MAQLETLVSVQALRKRFEGRAALDGVSLGVGQVEVCFPGSAGALKSTTMTMISSVLEPDHGTAKIAVTIIWRNPVEAMSRLGSLSEAAPAQDDMLVGCFLRFCGRMRGLHGGRLEDRLAGLGEPLHLRLL